MLSVSLEDVYWKACRWDLATYKRHLGSLPRYLSTLLNGIGRTERRLAIARYVEGLLLPGRRKFIRPLAERLNVDSQSLQQAITNSPWDDREIWSAIRSDVIPLFEPFDRWVIAERAWTKQGNSTAAVDNQRCGANGKKQHCQVSIEVLASDGAIVAPAAARLYLPEAWATDGQRRRRAEIPEDVAFSTKPALAIQLIKEAARDSVQPAVVVADSSYGNDQDFRLALIRLGFEFFLEIDPSSNQAWDCESTMPGIEGELSTEPCGLEDIVSHIQPAEWRNCSWTNVDGVPRRTRLATREILLDSGPYHIQNSQEKVLLVVDWPVGDPKPYRCYVSQFSKPPTNARLLRLSRFRTYEGFYNECFDRTLDLGCYQGRSWKGFHHHLVLAAAAYLFLLTVELKGRRPFCPSLSEDYPIDQALAVEIARFASVLLRSGNPVDHRNGYSSTNLILSKGA
jgi:SRSO17 transposase